MHKQLFLRKRIDKDFDLPQAIIEVANRLREWKGTQPLQYTGQPVRKIDLTRTDIENYLDEIESRNRVCDHTPFSLSSHRSNPSVILFFNENAIAQEQTISIPLSVSDLEDFAHVQSLVDILGDLGVLFEATHGFTPNRRLGELHGCKLRQYKQEIERAESSRKQFIPKPVLPNGVKDDLPKLLLPSEFDYHLVPDRVWWINYWSNAHVNNIGLERIREAPWEMIKSLPNEGLLLLATPSPLDIFNRQHLDRIKDITSVLKLGEIQDKCKYNP